MKTCKSCGAEIGDNAKFCTSCGTPVPVEAVPVEPVQYAQPDPTPVQYGQPDPSPVQYGQPMQYGAASAVNTPAAPANSGMGIAGLILGIASIVFSFLGYLFAVGGLLPLALAIVGLILSNKAAKVQPTGVTKGGKITSIIGLVFTILSIIIGVILIIVVALAASYY